jgi:putative FmdB family regulatory protein
MPFYEYECKACGHHHEAMQKISAAPLRKCPACGKSRLVRLLSAPVFRLKGGGWYETDFKSDKEGRRNLHAEEKADKAEGTATDTTAATKAGSTAAAATEPAKGGGTAEPTTTDKPAKAAPAGRVAPPARKPARKRARRR